MVPRRHATSSPYSPSVLLPQPSYHTAYCYGHYHTRSHDEPPHRILSREYAVAETSATRLPNSSRLLFSHILRPYHSHIYASAAADTPCQVSVITAAAVYVSPLILRRQAAAAEYCHYAIIPLLYATFNIAHYCWHFTPFTPAITLAIIWNTVQFFNNTSRYF
jgi:hypothetical protein